MPSMRIRDTLALNEAGPGPLEDRYRVLESLGRWLRPDLLREALPDFHRYHPQLHATIGARLLAEIAATRLPPRANRANPRVVKQRCSPFPAKRPSHAHWPHPTMPFAQAVVLLG